MSTVSTASTATPLHQLHQAANHKKDADLKDLRELMWGDRDYARFMQLGLAAGLGNTYAAFFTWKVKRQACITDLRQCAFGQPQPHRRLAHNATLCCHLARLPHLARRANSKARRNCFRRSFRCRS